MWSGIRKTTGVQRKGGGVVEGNVQQANEFNLFFNRFDTGSSTSSSPLPITASAASTGPLPLVFHRPLPDHSHILTICVHSSPHVSPPCQTGLYITADKVRKELERLNQSALKACASQLCEVLQHLFNLSFHLQRDPLLWKTYFMVPVPKNRHPMALNDYRPIALTSHLMKVMKRLAHLRPLMRFVRFIT